MKKIIITSKSRSPVRRKGKKGKEPIKIILKRNLIPAELGKKVTQESIGHLPSKNKNVIPVKLSKKVTVESIKKTSVFF